ncbi:MAG: hypothetical protein B7X96_01180 [Novosphingobium sp. 17-62-8]|nr:MAG: hypothetical protein B7X96_01180 [Novosphingobium sp. 17-62-8]
MTFALAIVLSGSKLAQVTFEVRGRMAQRKEAGRRNMSIFQVLPTQRWAILVEPLRGVQMASI